MTTVYITKDIGRDTYNIIIKNKYGEKKIFNIKGIQKTFEVCDLNCHITNKTVFIFDPLSLREYEVSVPKHQKDVFLENLKNKFK